MNILIPEIVYIMYYVISEYRYAQKGIYIYN